MFLQKTMFSLITVALLVVTASVTSGYVAYRYAVKQYSLKGAEMSMIETSALSPTLNVPQNAGDIDPSNGKKVLYWHDPMVPGQRFSQPGQSPFMDMMLVPVYVQDSEGASVTISAHMQQNMGLRVTPVINGRLTQTISTFGNVTYNERDQVVVSNRVPVTIERLRVQARLDPVTKGQPLAEYVAPEWDYLQADLLAALSFTGPGAASLVDGARRRLLLAGMNEEQLKSIEKAGVVQRRFVMRAPIDGMVTELNVSEGSTVMPGTTLFRIHGMNRVWVEALVPQSKAAGIHIGTAVHATTPNFPGEVFRGKIQTLLGEVDPATRTVRARMEINNVPTRLAPGMYVDIQIKSNAEHDALLIPTDAVIRRGETHVVIVAADGGIFQPVEVTVGAASDEQVEISTGLSLGQNVVVSGQFLIDSEANVNAAFGRMGNNQPTTAVR